MISRYIERGVGLLVGAAALLGGAALVFITAVVCMDVVGRYFGAPLFGARDLVQMASVFAVFGGMAFADRREGHIQVDLIRPFLSEGTNRVLTLAGYAFGFAAFALIGWQLWKASGFSMMLNAATNLLRIPQAPFQIALALLVGVAAIQMAWRIFTILTRREERP